MKKLCVFVLLALVTVSTSMFAIDVDSIDPADVDLSKVDFSDIEFYFQGPFELYVSNVKYADMYYAAILDHDGAGNLTIKVPNRVSTYLKPQEVNLSDIDVSFKNSKIYLENVKVEDYSYSGYLTIESTNEMRVETGSVSAERLTPSDRPFTSGDEGEVRVLKQKVDNLEKTIREKEREIDQLLAKMQRLEKDLMRVQTQIPKDELTYTVLSGFRGGDAALGSWSTSSSRARQTDSDQKFAKYIGYGRQSSNEYLYSFTGKATGKGWAGYGLHFLASDSETAKGYGFGESYLVWVTRDEGNLQTDRTFVQLYKSNSDVRMIQLASQAIDQDISDELDIEVYVNRSKGQIMVAVEGSIELVYDDMSSLTAGDAGALRTLGAAEFTNLTVKTK
jgi:hypothetical protein